MPAEFAVVTPLYLLVLYVVVVAKLFLILPAGLVSEDLRFVVAAAAAVVLLLDPLWLLFDLNFVALSLFWLFSSGVAAKGVVSYIVVVGRVGCVGYVPDRDDPDSEVVLDPAGFSSFAELDLSGLMPPALPIIPPL